MQETIAVRSGKPMNIPVEKLVIGDIVEVKFGDRLPADIRIIESAGFKVSLLESMVIDDIYLYIRIPKIRSSFDYPHPFAVMTIMVSKIGRITELITFISPIHVI